MAGLNDRTYTPNEIKEIWNGTIIRDSRRASRPNYAYSRPSTAAEASVRAAAGQGSGNWNSAAALTTALSRRADDGHAAYAIERETIRIMKGQPQLLQIPLVTSDVIYTPDWVARDMVDFFRPSGRILEPCKGDGVFLKYLPSSTEWCEIQEGRDFFKWIEPVDWIIGNPPYADYSKFINHSMEVANHICYLIPANKPFNSGKMLQDWVSWGKPIHLRYYGTGAKLGFPIGFAIAAVYFQKDYHGPMYTTIYEGQKGIAP